MKIKKFMYSAYTSKIDIKDKEVYEFQFDKKVIDKAMKRDFKDPLLLSKNNGWNWGVFGLYGEKGKLNVILYHSYIVFEELNKNHKLKEKGQNFAKCVCGRNFMGRDELEAIKKLDKHIKQIKEVMEK